MCYFCYEVPKETKKFAKKDALSLSLPFPICALFIRVSVKVHRENLHFAMLKTKNPITNSVAKKDSIHHPLIKIIFSIGWTLIYLSIVEFVQNIYKKTHVDYTVSVESKKV